jgi:hypothetical protein
VLRINIFFDMFSAYVLLFSAEKHFDGSEALME